MLRCALVWCLYWEAGLGGDEGRCDKVKCTKRSTRGLSSLLDGGLENKFMYRAVTITA